MGHASAIADAPASSASRPGERDAIFQGAIEKLYPKLIQTRRDLHRHPELSNQEERTGRYVALRLRDLGLKVQTGVAGHGVVALLEGTGASGAAGCVAVRADMDALPITELGDKEYRSEKAGVMHACGHDVHMTCALGVAELLSQHRDRVAGTVKFIFQPAEEAMPATYPDDWGAKLMVAQGVLENPRPLAIFGLHSTPIAAAADGPDRGVDAPLEAGRIGYCRQAASATSDRFQIIIKGKLAHGSAPHKGVDAIAVAAQAIQALQTIRSRQTNTLDPLVITVGMIQGGTRENILADRVEMSGTVRSFSNDVRDSVVEMMHRVLCGVTEAHGASYELNYRKGYPSIFNDDALTDSSVETLERIFGPQKVVQTMAGMGGEDFSYFSEVVPGFYYKLGVANVEQGIVASVHTADFDIDETCLKAGVGSMAALVCDYLDQLADPPTR